jgi:hypothetical protein
MKKATRLVLGAGMAMALGPWSAQAGDIFLADVNTTIVRTNHMGGLSHNHFGTANIIAAAAQAAGETNLMELRLVFNRSEDELEVVKGTNNAVIATPFTFSGGVSVSKTNGAVVERLSWVHLGDDPEPKGVLRVTEHIAHGQSNVITGFLLNGVLQFATPASQTSEAALYTGTITAVPLPPLAHMRMMGP